MSKNRRFSEKERERETSQRSESEGEEEEEEATSAGESLSSLSHYLSLFDARASAKELRVLVFIRVFYLIFPYTCFKFPHKTFGENASSAPNAPLPRSLRVLRGADDHR
jgi:hypothetical protein